MSSAGYLDVQQVSGMWTFGIVFSVFLRSWVEMPSCAHEIRAFALANRMNVNSMGAGRQLRDTDINANPATAARHPWNSRSYDWQVRRPGFHERRRASQPNFEETRKTQSRRSTCRRLAEHPGSRHWTC